MEFVEDQAGLAKGPRIGHSHCWCFVLSAKSLMLKAGNPVVPTHILSQGPMRLSASEPRESGLLW